MSAAPRAVVAGAGIGGLAAALGLRRGGWQVRVLERRTAGQVAAQAGSGISIWPNGLAALAALGVDEQALAGTALSRNGVRTASGRWVSRTDIGAPMRERFGRPLIITSRARLAAALTDALGPGLVEYGATATAPPGGHADDERDELRRRFSAWHPPVPELLAALPPGAVIRTDIGYLADPPPAWHRGRAALLGDAAHAMPPDLGQGGCQALEDAATLAALLPARLSGDVPGALARYTALRAGRAADVARRSVRAGRLYEAPMWLRTLTARAVSVLPAALLVRGLAPVVAWEPRAPPAAAA